MTIRLNKVTRDLNVGITTVVEFLQKKGYTIEANPNTRITDEQYAMLVKEFSKDKDLKIKSERIFQERQNKGRNKTSVSIEDLHPEAKEPEMIETVIPEEALPKFKPVGKIDLENLNKKPKQEEKEVQPAAESEQPAQPVAGTNEQTVTEEDIPQPDITNKEDSRPTEALS